VESFKSYFSQSDFMPHGHCYLWNPGLVWTHVISDMLIGVAYVSISLSLYALIRKIRLPFSAVVLSFGIFIGACGATHFMEVWNLWQADYWWAALIKVLTAIASVSTGLWLIKLKPQIILVAEAAKVSEERRALLEKINAELQTKSEELARTNQVLAEQQKILVHSAKMSALGEMAGGIAHEINSPLGIITVHANQMERFLKRNILTPELISKEAQLIAATAKRIGDIIKGLRAFAREGDKDPFEVTSVHSIIQDALALCQTRFRNSEVELRVVEIAPELQLECRSVQIGQVMLNLLMNAYDAVLPLPEKWVELEVKRAGDSVAFSVTDSGHGIPLEVQSKLMQPFFTTKEVGKGTGLGLSISKGIAETHFGTLEFDQLSPHTRFVLTLPARHTRKSLS
jgi:C4-dicarboxylate-specific signal transduction histidine kinase